MGLQVEVTPGRLICGRFPGRIIIRRRRTDDYSRRWRYGAKNTDKVVLTTPAPDTIFTSNSFIKK